MHDHLIATVIIVAALALFACLATAAGINNRRREGQALDDHFNSHRLPGEGDVLTDYSRVQDTDWTEFVVAHTRPVPVVDFEEGA